MITQPLVCHSQLILTRVKYRFNNTCIIVCLTAVFFWVYWMMNIIEYSVFFNAIIKMIFIDMNIHNF